jgi:putative redox protein
VTIETKRVKVAWQQGLIFRGGEPGGSEAVIDGDNAAAPGPMLTLLLAAAACTGSDVVLVLGKMRVVLKEFTIEVAGVRRERDPRRYTDLHFEYFLRGDGLDEARGRRAVELSIEKYCSVVHSLAPDIRITHGLTLG